MTSNYFLLTFLASLKKKLFGSLKIMFMKYGGCFRAKGHILVKSKCLDTYVLSLKQSNLDQEQGCTYQDYEQRQKNKDIKFKGL